MLISIHDRAELAALLRRDPELNAYQLGDLDDFFWPYTTWYRDGDATALIYHGGDPPTLLAVDRAPEPTAALLTALRPLLPVRFHAHLTVGAEHALADAYDLGPLRPHLKLALQDRARLDAAAAEGDVLGPDDLPELAQLYTTAYPGNWFDKRMLETGHYVGVRREGQIVAVAGVHVWSPTYRIAALGNVTTHPDWRGRGVGTAAVAALCRGLLETVDVITLNVAADNAAAITVYTRLGFAEVARYTEFGAVARH